MKRILRITAILLVLGAPIRAFAEDVVYSQAIDDLPLMQNMTELPENTIIFDTPEGRIIETITETKVAENQVISYYDKNLPQLGWRPLGQEAFGLQSYLRDGEKLSLRAVHGGPMLRIHFSLSPTPEKKE